MHYLDSNTALRPALNVFFVCSACVHRDIKPRNLLVMPSPALQLKAADCGCVKELEPPQSAVWGTWGYVQPKLLACRDNQQQLESALQQLGGEAHSLDMVAAAVTLVEAYSGAPTLLKGMQQDAKPQLPEYVLHSK